MSVRDKYNEDPAFLMQHLSDLAYEVIDAKSAIVLITLERVVGFVILC